MRLKSLDLFSPSREKYCRLPRIETSDRPTTEPTVSGIIATSRCACYQSIACLLQSGRGPHTRHTDTTKHRTVAYLSGMGQRWQMFLPPGADNPSYAQPGSANAAASVCLYREQERPLRFQPIIRRQAWGLPY